MVTHLIAAYTHMGESHDGYSQTSNISGTLDGNKIVDQSDVVGACRHCSNNIFILNLSPGFSGLGKVLGFGAPYIRSFMVV